MHLVGEGSFADRRLVRDGKVSLPGKVVTVARHLCSHLGDITSFAHELPRRRQATMTAFYSVGQLLFESRVSWRLKRCFSIGRVDNTALSGIEAFSPSKAQYQSLTSLVTCLARKVMAGAAARRERTWARSHNDQQGGTAFLEIGTLWCGSPGAKTQNGHRLWCRTLRTTHIRSLPCLGNCRQSLILRWVLVAKYHQRPIRGRCGGWQIWKNWSRMMRGEWFSV